MEDVLETDTELLDAYYKVSVLDTEISDTSFSFNYDIGIKIKDFLEDNNFGCLYVCCDSGESRSTAMAAAIMRYYGKSDKEIWTNHHYHPNLLVYKEQMRAFGFKVGKLRMKYLKYINNKALNKVMKKTR